MYEFLTSKEFGKYQEALTKTLGAFLYNAAKTDQPMANLQEMALRAINLPEKIARDKKYNNEQQAIISKRSQNNLYFIHKGMYFFEDGE